MADEKTQEEEPKKKGKGKLIIIVLAVVVLVVAGVAVKMFVLGGKKEEVKGEKKKVEHQKKQEQETEEDTEDYGEAMDESGLEPVVVGPMIANLADEGGDRYLKVKIVLLEAKKKAKEAKKEEESTGISLEDAIIKDVILNTISSKTSDDLLSISGKEELKNEIITAINKAVHKRLVRKIFFTEFIIQ